MGRTRTGAPARSARKSGAMAAMGDDAGGMADDVVMRAAVEDLDIGRRGEGPPRERGAERHHAANGQRAERFDRRGERGLLLLIGRAEGHENDRPAIEIGAAFWTAHAGCSSSGPT